MSAAALVDVVPPEPELAVLRAAPVAPLPPLAPVEARALEPLDAVPDWRLVPALPFEVDPLGFPALSPEPPEPPTTPGEHATIAVAQATIGNAELGRRMSFLVRIACLRSRTRAPNGWLPDLGNFDCNPVIASRAD